MMRPRKASSDWSLAGGVVSVAFMVVAGLGTDKNGGGLRISFLFWGKREFATPRSR